MTRAEFARELSTKRKQAGITQAQLAQQINLETSHLCRIEKGQRNPPKRPTVIAIGNALNLDDQQTSQLLIKADYAPLAASVPQEGDEISRISREVRDIIESVNTTPLERSQLLAVVQSIPAMLTAIKHHLKP